MARAVLRSRGWSMLNPPGEIQGACKAPVPGRCGPRFSWIAGFKGNRLRPAKRCDYLRRFAVVFPFDPAAFFFFGAAFDAVFFGAFLGGAFFFAPAFWCGFLRALSFLGEAFFPEDFEDDDGFDPEVLPAGFSLTVGFEDFSFG